MILRIYYLVRLYGNTAGFKSVCIRHIDNMVRTQPYFIQTAYFSLQLFQVFNECYTDSTMPTTHTFILFIYLFRETNNGTL